MYLSARIQQIFSGTRDVSAVNPRVWMHEVPLVDDLRLVVREEQK